MNWILETATKFFLRSYIKGKRSALVRAVFIGDEISRTIILKGSYEARELDAMKQLIFPKIPNKSIALDIGGNIGNHALFFSKFFTRVITFEANPMTAHLLRANAMLAANVEVVGCGLSEKDGLLNFDISETNIGASRIVSHQTDQKVKVTSLDNLESDLNLETVSFIKMDVEGHERNVILGGLNVLSKHKPIIVMEASYNGNSDKANEVWSSLKAAGYQNLYMFQTKFPKFLNFLLGGKESSFLKKYFPLQLVEVSDFVNTSVDLVIVTCDPI